MKKVGVSLAGHQKKILNSIQEMRVQMANATIPVWGGSQSCLTYSSSLALSHQGHLFIEYGTISLLKEKWLVIPEDWLNGWTASCACVCLCTTRQPPDSFDRSESDVLAVKHLEKCGTFPVMEVWAECIALFQNLMQQYYYLQNSTRSPVYLRQQMLLHMFAGRKGHAVRLDPYQSVKLEAAVYYKAILDFELDNDYNFLLDMKEEMGVYVQFPFAQYVS